MYLAYKFVTLALMLAEANFCASKLELPIKTPITETNLTCQLIVPPTAIPYGGQGGRIDANGYSFCVGGRLRFITKLETSNGQSAADKNAALSKDKSLINSTQACELAQKWLTALDVDLARLEKANKPQVRQRWFFGEGNPAPKILLPIFQVRWGDWDDAKVEVEIDGRNKQLLSIRQEDDSFSRRAPQIITNLDKLLAIPDAEFSAYSPLQRSNLVVRFAANQPSPQPPAQSLKR